jgi:hypothetical protein
LQCQILDFVEERSRTHRSCGCETARHQIDAGNIEPSHGAPYRRTDILGESPGAVQLQLVAGFRLCRSGENVNDQLRNDTTREDFKTALEGLIAAARETGLSDEAIIGELADAAEALREGLS